MKKADLMSLIGKRLNVWFKDGTQVTGELGYVPEFSALYGNRKVGDFYVGNTSFRVSHVTKVKEVSRF